MRYGIDYDQEDEAARLLRKHSGFVVVWSDGSVSWKARLPDVFADDACFQACSGPDLSDSAARAWYTHALRRHFLRRRAEATYATP